MMISMLLLIKGLFSIKGEVTPLLSLNPGQNMLITTHTACRWKHNMFVQLTAAASTHLFF